MNRVFTASSEYIMYNNNILYREYKIVSFKVGWTTQSV